MSLARFGEFLRCGIGHLAQTRHAAHRIEREREAVHVIEHAHVERRGGCAFFLVAADVNPVVICSAIGQAMNQRRIAVEGKDDGLVLREHAVEVFVGQAVRMLGDGLQRHQIHDVHNADFEIGNMLTQQRDGGQRLQRRHVTGAGHYDIGIAVVVARPVPDAEARSAVANGLVHGEPDRRWLLAGDDEVDVVPAAQTVASY